MKVCFLGNFRVPFTSENDYLWTMRQMGIEVIPLQETQATGDQIEAEALKCDYFFWVHTHEWVTYGKPMSEVLKTLRRNGVVSFAYHLDLWLGIKRQKDMINDPFWGVDHFFTVDPQMADYLNENTSVKGHYLRPGVVERDCYMVDTEKVRDIIFVGSYDYHPEHQYRRQLIDWLKETYGDRFELWGQHGKGIVRGAALNKLYGETKIVIGDSLCKDFTYKGYWSDRVYETLGRGGFLIHPFIDGMEDEFKDAEDFVFYYFGDFKQLKQKIDYYLENNEEREMIRKNGHEKVKSNYTYTDRLKEIFSVLEKEPKPEIIEEPERDIHERLLEKVAMIPANPNTHLGDLVFRKDVINTIREDKNGR